MNILLLLFLLFLVCFTTRIPVKILVPDETKTKLVILKDGLEILQGIGNQSVSVITFIGRARTGKSFTLDNLLNISYETGFEVGHTNKPKTVGVDFWPQLIKVNGDDYIVFDTEGLGTGPQTYDKALLLLLTLISSRIVYHVSEYVYTDDISRLYAVACLAAHYESRGMLNKSHHCSDILITDLLPPISWLVQKYRLKLTSASALDDWLGEKENPDNNPFISRFNTTVRIVRTLFPLQTVHLIPPADLTLSIPSASTAIHLTDVPRESLYPGYLDGMKTLSDTLFNPKYTYPKRLKGIRTPVEIANAIVDLLPAANLGFEYVGDKVAETLSRAILAETLNRMTINMSSINLPLENKDLENQITIIRQMAIVDLEINLPSHATTIIGMVPKFYINDLDTRISVEADRLRKENEYQSDKLCTDLEKKAIDFFASPEKIRKFNGNLAIFDAAYEIAVTRYKEKAVGPAAERHLMAIDMCAENTRKLIAVDTTPKRKIVWSILSTSIFAIAHFLDKITKKCGRSTFFFIFFTMIQLAAGCITIISVWSIFDTPPLEFEVIADTFTLLIHEQKLLLVIIMVIILLVFVLVNSTENKKKKIQ